MISKYAIIDQNAIIGKETAIEEFSVVAKNATIGDECKIHRNIYVDQEVIIGNRVKIQDNVMIPRGVIIEDGVFIGPGVAFTNDKYPRSINKDGTIKNCKDWKQKKTIVKFGASIGANATIICGICLNEWSMVAAGSVVTKDVPPYTLVAGNPAHIIKKVDF